MLGNLKLKTIIYVLAALIVSFMLYSYLSSLKIQQNVDNLDRVWDSYQANQNEKTRLRAELIMQLGYNGLIHKYDIYILRKTEQHRIEAWMSYGQVQNTLEKLIRIASTHGERSALEDIQKVVVQIGTNLKYVERQLAKGISATAILREIDIDFSRATRALENLNQAFQINYINKENAGQKDKVFVSIAAAFGLNGFIQAYKRYIILGDEIEIDKALAHAENIKQLAETYTRFDITFGEKLAIEDIVETLAMYLEMLDVAQTMHATGVDSGIIDHAVRIDDGLAVRGFEILEAVNVEQILDSASSVHNSIMNLQKLQIDYMYQHAGFLLLLLLLINYITVRYVIRPIENISGAFFELSHGNIEVELERDENKDNEIGIMEEAFELFREHEIRRQSAEEELRKLATTDHMTGLVNRNELEKRFIDLTNIISRSGESIAIMMLDLDNFKLVNDNFGHHVGDELLIDIGKIMISETRKTDIVARIGGDEFAIVLYAPKSKNYVELLAQRIIDKISRLHYVRENTFDVGVSIGLMFEQGPDISSLKTLMARADKALYQAKRSGKNRVIELKAELAKA